MAVPWILKLDGDLLSWDDPDARKWSANLSPLVDQFRTDLLQFMKTLTVVQSVSLIRIAAPRFPTNAIPGNRLRQDL